MRFLIIATVVSEPLILKTVVKGDATQRDHRDANVPLELGFVRNTGTEINYLADGANGPTGRNLSELGALEGGGKKRGGVGVEAGRLAAVKLIADWVEVNEPTLEERPRHSLQRRVHSSVQLNFLLEKVERVSNLPLLFN